MTGRSQFAGDNAPFNPAQSQPMASFRPTIEQNSFEMKGTERSQMPIANQTLVRNSPREAPPANYGSPRGVQMKMDDF